VCVPLSVCVCVSHCVCLSLSLVCVYPTHCFRDMKRSNAVGKMVLIDLLSAELPQNFYF